MGELIGSLERAARAAHVEIWDEVANRLELVVLWAVGDAEGPSVGEVKIGVSTRDALARKIENIQAERAYPVKVFFETVISGRGKAELLRCEALKMIPARGMRPAWRRINAENLAAIVGLLATQHRARIMTREEAVALEHEIFDVVAAERAQR